MKRKRSVGPDPKSRCEAIKQNKNILLHFNAYKHGMCIKIERACSVVYMSHILDLKHMSLSRVVFVSLENTSLPCFSNTIISFTHFTSNVLGRGSGFWKSIFNSKLVCLTLLKKNSFHCFFRVQCHLFAEFFLSV